MSTVLTIDNVQLTAQDVINFLKFNNEFEEIANRIISDKLTVLAAGQRGISVSDEELQGGADDFRRFAGMHRAKDTEEWMKEMNVSVDDFESFIKDLLLKNKMMLDITSDEAINDYFRLHSPKFEAVDLKHIVIAGKDKANEIFALLEDDEDMFDELVIEHSIDEDTRFTQGRMMNVRRGTLGPDLEAKVFNASKDDLVGPVQLGDEDFFEIVQVLKFHPAELDEDIKMEVSKAIHEEWLADRAKDVQIKIN
ncbi:MAG: peptidylprolyl isomerase [Thermodesulfobacteriota bacterium]